MSGATPTYSFLSWARQGLANAITTASTVSSLRPTIEIGVEIEGDVTQATTVTNMVHLVGPGDIVGISPQAIIRQEPRNWAKDFLPNYLPFIEFYDEDFPWRHTPAAPDTALDQLHPWIALVVLEESEFTEIQGAGGPLPAFRTQAAGAEVFPPWSQLWAWAHVQVNADVVTQSPGVGLSAAAVTAGLAPQLAANPDLGCARLICPRKLKQRTSYHAFLIPSYETGRCAGLGIAPDPSTSATTSAWDNGQNLFPYYFRWEFGTASRGDFEYLVGLLKPRPVDPRVGTRGMFVGNPGGGMPPPSVPVLGLEGALQSPSTIATAWPGAAPEPFQNKLTEFINQADGVQAAVYDGDPVVTPPLYGRWHALHPKLALDAGGGSYPYPASARWITELNLDPRHRAAAGLGASVVRADQEALMNEAWWQVGDILKANAQIRAAQVALEASGSIYDRTMTTLSSDARMSITQLLHGQIMGSEETIRSKVRSSRVPAGAFSPAFRRMVRPRGRLARSAFPGEPRRPQAKLFSRINAGELSHAPAKTPPAAAMTLASLAAEPAIRALGPGPGRGPASLLLGIAIALLRVALAGLKLVAVLPFARKAVQRAIDATQDVIARLTLLRVRPTPQQALSEEAFTPQAIQSLPGNAAFRIARPDEPVSFAPGGTDSLEARRFKSALGDIALMLAPDVPPEPAPVPLDLDHLDHATRSAILPTSTIIPRVADRTQWAGQPAEFRVSYERFTPILAYPVFQRPMYEALRDMSADYLIPNLDLVPPNTIALLKENRRFIEAYMVGLNHEIASEFCWREYPTDKRVSSFRQFWDVRDSLRPANVSEAVWTERNRDIPEIHLWSKTAPLGGHPNHTVPPGQDPAVLIIRGALLSRFPNILIYAHRAQWKRNPDNSLNKAAARELAPALTEADRNANTRFPIYSAVVPPDVYFLGFDLSIAEAKGGGPNDDPGWFFAFKERPGETLFGLDIEDSAGAKPAQWDDLSWEDLNDPSLGWTGTLRDHIILPTSSGTVKANDPEILGRDAFWSTLSNSAAIAAILYQDPVLVAVHAKEMLK